MKRLQEYVNVEDRCIRLATLLDAGEDIYHEAEKALFRLFVYPAMLADKRSLAIFCLLSVTKTLNKLSKGGLR